LLCFRAWFFSSLFLGTAEAIKSESTRKDPNTFLDHALGTYLHAHTAALEQPVLYRSEGAR
jgi:hypothetical protein